MSKFLSELFLALEVMKRWETLAAFALFIVVWSLFRYIALVRRRLPGLRFRLPRRLPRPEAPAPTPPSDENPAGIEEES